MNKTLSTPVLLLCFNRPDNTRRVFESIRAVRPRKLFVAIDGPRVGKEDDKTKREEVISIVKNVDWECETHYLIHENNLGCSLSGVTAWRWLFEQEDRMLFIEDDGLGNESAFYFVQEMLEKYKDDDRIAYVGAVNYGMTYGNVSYFFSRYPVATYYMGTWKRVFEKYEYDIESFRKTRYKVSFLKNYNTFGEYLRSTKGMQRYVESIQQGKRFNTYDIQMIYLSYKYDMYSIYPNVNMVSNIGLNDGANNHVDINDPFYKQYANRKRFELVEIKHPEAFSVDKSFEHGFYNLRCLYGCSRFRATLRVIQPKWFFNLHTYFRSLVLRKSK